jgi:hypothetical protein
MALWRLTQVAVDQGKPLKNFKKSCEKYNLSKVFPLNRLKNANSDLKSWGPLINIKPEEVHFQARSYSSVSKNSTKISLDFRF